MESRFWEAAVSTRFHRKIRHKRLFDSARRGILIVRNKGGGAPDAGETENILFKLYAIKNCLSRLT